MPENFYQRAAAPAKHVEIAGMRVALETLLHRSRFSHEQVKFERRTNSSSENSVLAAS
jgi:hypothetical protein